MNIKRTRIYNSFRDSLRDSMMPIYVVILIVCVVLLYIVAPDVYITEDKTLDAIEIELAELQEDYNELYDYVFNMAKENSGSSYMTNSDIMYIKTDDISNRLLIFTGFESDVEIICRDLIVNGQKVGGEE